MRKILVLVSMSFLGTGIAHAQEFAANPAQVFADAIAEGRRCEFSTLKASLNNMGLPKEEWAKPDEEGEILDKLVSGSPNYIRALESLSGSTRVDPRNHSFRRTDVGLPEELSYYLGRFRLRTLDVVFDERLERERWVPERLEVTIKYWWGLGFGRTTFDKYHVVFDCNLD